MPSVRFRIDAAPPRIVAITSAGERELPALWLRERCQDDAHFDAQSHQRLFDPHVLPDDIRLDSVEAGNDNDARLTFSDGYRGHYDLDVLAAEFDPADGIPAPIPWDSGIDRVRVSYAWPGLDDERAFRDALEAFLAFGFLVLRDVPTDPEHILTVARTFGHPRSTNFGLYFEVYSRAVSNDLAYRSVPLGPHTDNPYRDPVPGIQILHCLVNENPAGLSTLTDSLAVGEALRAEDREAFNLLVDTPVRFRFFDNEAEFIERRPIIRLNATGEMTGLHYSPRLDYLPLLGTAELAVFQRARRRLGELLADSRFQIRFSLHTGELLMFDNSRIVHGRTGFDPREGRRHLQGCYIDIDEPRSRYRMLTRRLEAGAQPGRDE